MPLRDELEAAISQALSARGEFATKWVAIIETIDGDEGSKSLWTLCDKTSTSWDRMGMLAHAAEKQRSALSG